ncbi:DsbA family protein [Helcobacillus sp. ACRRO]|uniref:DsbA family protein n=1 Tax=Helcobacillus TaxID=1161125 RepID=UPI001EF553B1|nr:MULTISPECIES: DsbA family protein [Helcobacillus]MCG7426328.1 DsbA family protein [Helcobacillus sp. ACRRO]MDK7742925.1 DsbA family protein [Helcobacillus massiliensis]WOO92082.1 DsbA family protein [Helcobacillus massiliensis]
MAQIVDVFVDPTCPFAWLTSRWALNAAEVRDVRIRFQPMSLSVLNEGRDLDPDYMEAMRKAWGPARLQLAIDEQHGQDAFSTWYTAWGTRFHVQDQKDDYRRVAVEALEEAGLPTDLADAMDTDTNDDALRAAQKRAQDLVGDDVGTPVISFGSGTAYFGPVLSRAPRGEEAGRLLDAMATMAEINGFAELKRKRDPLDFS